MTEKTDYKRLRKNMKQPLDRLDRIENVVGVGTPDVNYCIEGVEGWIEIKSPSAPKRKTTAVLKSQHNLNQDQKNWFKSQFNAGGTAWILLCMKTKWILVSGSWADQVNEMTTDRLLEISAWKANAPIFIGQWETLRMRLKNEVQNKTL